MSPADGPRIAVTCGDPRGIGPEVIAGALRGLPGGDTRPGVRFLLVGPADVFSDDLHDHPRLQIDSVGSWPAGGDRGDRAAGRVSVEAIERGIELALSGEVDGLVTGPVSKAAVAAAGAPWPGHTELLRERAGVEEVTMIMAAERTPLGGPLRVALLTMHVALRTVPDLLTRELVERRSRIAATALRDWWGIDAPRLAYAGLNPHASEHGLFGDEEERVFMPALRVLETEGWRVAGPFPADTAFRRCPRGEADLVVAPYHDVGLAVLKTLAPERAINVTAGLPFPRVSPGHGTALDIAGQGRADPRSMRAAIDACVRFCRARFASRDGRG